MKKKKSLKTFFSILVFLLTFLFVDFSGCKTIENKKLKETYSLPVCLLLTQESKRQSEKIQKDLKEQSQKMNKALGGQFFNIHPNCNPLKDTYVSIIFVDKFDEKYTCSNPKAFGCVRRFRNKTTGKITYQDIIILEPYLTETIRHELAHLAGCEHGEYRKPCWM